METLSCSRLVTALVFVLLAMSTSAQEIALITEWTLPDPTVGPAYMAPDGQGGYWFTEQNAVRLAHFDPATGVLNEWVDPSPFVNFGIAVDDQGFVWYAAWSRAFVRFDPNTNRFETFDIPTSFPIPYMVETDGRICTTEFFRNAIGCLDPATRILTEWFIPTPLTEPEGIVAASDGSLWFGENSGRKIARLDPLTGIVNEWPIPGSGALRLQIAIDFLGNVWFPQFEDGKLSKLDPLTSEITDYPLPDPDAGLFAVRDDEAGRLWFSESLAPGIGRFDPLAAVGGVTATVVATVSQSVMVTSTSNVIDWGVEVPVTTTLQPAESLEFGTSAGGFQEWPLPTAAAGTGDLAVASDRQVWFLEFEAGKIGSLDLDVGNVTLLDAIETTIDEMITEIDLIGVPGANGMINKLEQVADTVVQAVTDFNAGNVSAQQFFDQLDAALSKLNAFDNQVTGKTGSGPGKISPAEAAELLQASGEVGALIERLQENV